MKMSSGALELLKWIALILMTGDHVNMYLFNSSLPYLFEAGRLALPLFIFVLSYNLARPSVMRNNKVLSVMKRLALFGIIATVPFIALGQVLYGWWPLNILFTLFTIAAVIYYVSKEKFSGYFVAVIIFIVGGALVQFWWPAIALGVSSWYFFRKPSVFLLIVTVCCCASLWLLNVNFWALASLPILFVFTKINLQLPRFRLGFYVYYPAHLALLWLIRIPMGYAGYVFIGGS